MQEAKELANDPSTDYSAAPLELLPDPPVAASGSTNVGANTIEDNTSAPAEPSPIHSEPQASEPAVPEPHTISSEPAVIHHSIDTLLPSGSGAAAGQTRPAAFITRAAVDTPTAVRSMRKPPLVLIDGAICMLFIVAFAIICRRIS
ncbi:hypothetical protein C0991_008828 [Blastosporella zonata]|nr:hypothetical protein C0991_008828 [Blastosporella zonata]